MTRIKLCGLVCPEDILAANALLPEYVGFVFAPKSRRYLTPQRAAVLRALLDPRIRAVGVFVDEEPRRVAELLNQGILDLAQLHGSEDEDYLRCLRQQTRGPLLQAFRVRSQADVAAANRSTADGILLDSGAGTGKVLDWKLLGGVTRPYFLAGGLSPCNVAEAIALLHPFAVDVSSGIETDGAKDKTKMAAFVAAVRKEEPL